MNFSIKGRSIGPDHPPFIIAEMSGNHNQSLDRALQIVEAAAYAGVDAIKLQTYTADTMTINSRSKGFQIDSQNSSPWNNRYLYDLYEEAHTPWEWHQNIMEYARSKDLICFSSPFDDLSIDFLEALNVPAYKIASFENNHLPLISKAAQTGKPLIISTGMANLGEIENAVNVAQQNGCEYLTLLKCTSTYPSLPSNSNILTIPHLKDSFNVNVGLSDHTLGIGVALASIALGATVIEKHITLSREDGGIDSAFSLEPNEFKDLVSESQKAWQALGKIKYGPTESEFQSLQFRRSIYVVEDIVKGEPFTRENIRIIRPGDGGPPSLYNDLIGILSPKSFKKSTPLTLDKILE